MSLGAQQGKILKRYVIMSKNIAGSLFKSLGLSFYFLCVGFEKLRRRISHILRILLLLSFWIHVKKLIHAIMLI